MCIVERLFSSSLVALVETSNPRKLRLCHFKVYYADTLCISLFSFYQKNSEICTYSYPDSVLSVHLNRQVSLVK